MKNYIFLIPYFLFFINCQNNIPKHLNILKINKSHNFNNNIDSSLIQSCNIWSMNEDSIKTFFQLSEEYKNIPYGEYYTLPCNIEGELISNKEKYNFSINAGGISKWVDDKGQIRYFGCKSADCEKYLLISYDAME